MCCHATSSSVGKDFKGRVTHEGFSENPGTASKTATSTARSREVERFEDICSKLGIIEMIFNASKVLSDSDFQLTAFKLLACHLMLYYLNYLIYGIKMN